jgi:hypothetical protein
MVRSWCTWYEIYRLIRLTINLNEAFKMSRVLHSADGRQQLGEKLPCDRYSIFAGLRNRWYLNRCSSLVIDIIAHSLMSWIAFSAWNRISNDLIDPTLKYGGLKVNGWTVSKPRLRPVLRTIRIDLLPIDMKLCTPLTCVTFRLGHLPLCSEEARRNITLSI